jgi:hypothetical protein
MIFVLGAGASAVAGAPTASGMLPLAMQRQENDQWCWAAVASSVADFYGTGPTTQCAIAGSELGLVCCPAQPPAIGCDVPWYLDRALQRVGHLHCMTFVSESFATVQREVNGGKPLGARIAWSASGAHFVGLAGWSIDAMGTEYVDVHDPFYGFTTSTYASFVAGYRSPGDAWTHSYFTAAAPAADMAVVAGAPLSA